MRPKTYLQTLLGTLTQPSYYINILNQRLFFSFQFLAFSYLIIGLIVSLIIVQIDIPSYQQKFSQSLTELQQYYPEDLQISYKDNQISYNADQAINVDYPSVIEDKYRLYDQLAIINTQAQSADDQALFTISTDKLFVQDSIDNYLEFDLSEFSFIEQPLEITKDNLHPLSQKWQTEVDSILNQSKKYIFLLFPILIFVARFFTNLLDVLLVFLFLKLSGIKLKFNKVWQISFHVMVVSEIVAQVTGYLYPNNLLDMYQISYWLWFAVLLFHLRNVKPIVVIKNNKS